MEVTRPAVRSINDGEVIRGITTTWLALGTDFGISCEVLR